MGNLLDVGRTSTPNTNTLGRKVWTSYAPSTWFHQHYGGIFAYNGQGTFEIVVQFQITFMHINVGCTNYKPQKSSGLVL